jgi:hypothetical protein
MKTPDFGFFLRDKHSLRTHCIERTDLTIK